MNKELARNIKNFYSLSEEVTALKIKVNNEYRMKKKSGKHMVNKILQLHISHLFDGFVKNWSLVNQDKNAVRCGTT